MPEGTPHMAFAKDAGENAGSFTPFTGAEYLESLNDGREVWIYGERVKNITEHPAFRNSARMIARMYDKLHDPKTKDVLTTPTEWGGFTQRFYRAAKTVEEQVAQRDAIAEWQRTAWGWMGRSPDYKGSFLGTLGANAEFYKGFEDNARAWYRRAQERTWYVNHAIMHPPVDRDLPTADGSDVYVQVTRETDAGIYVSGAKVVATNSALTHYTFIAHIAQVPIADRLPVSLELRPGGEPARVCAGRHPAATALLFSSIRSSSRRAIRSARTVVIPPLSPPYRPHATAAVSGTGTGCTGSAGARAGAGRRRRGRRRPRSCSA